MRTVVTIALAALLMVLAASVTGCKSDSTSVSQGKGSVSGIVSDPAAGPLAGVSVQALIPGNTGGALTTDGKGYYTFTFDVDSTMAVTLVFKKTGYNDTSMVVILRSGLASSQDVVWSPLSSVIPPGGGGGSGLAQTVAFLGARTPRVSVYGVGGSETSILDWEVRDSLGLPIDAAHPIVLNFRILNGPGGGEFVSPASVQTNASGQVHMTFTAGIRSGVVQIVAEAVAPVSGRLLSSGPIRMVIVGGYPDQAHFTIATTRFNFPALGIANMRNPIAVLVGDKYGNPAAPSAIYFRSTAGVMQGSTQAVTTNEDGQGSADLISGNPSPLGIYAAAAYGDGYHYVAARTNGQGGVTVQDSILLLWSGPGHISNVAPTTFDIANAGSAGFSFTLTDVLGHPLAGGTRISVSAAIPPPPAEGVLMNQVVVDFAAGGTVALGDNLFGGPGITQFTFRLKDGSWDIIDPVGTPVTVTISVTGPNVSNSLSAVISGIVH